MSNRVKLQAEVPKAMSGERLDIVVAQLFPDYSRARLQSWIRSGCLLVNDAVLRPRDKVYTHDRIDLEALLEAYPGHEAQILPLAVIYEDEQLLVVNKATDTVVHPAAGHQSGTMMNGLLHHCPQLKLLPRAGIIHRLDKDTTGLLVVAKTLKCHSELIRQLQRREIRREYDAVVTGVMTAGGTIDAPLGRNPFQRKKRAVVASGKAATTHYKVIKRFKAHTHVRVRLETGRTHQIRVHLSHIAYPIVGDKTYGGRLQIPRNSSEVLVAQLRGFPRQALHARLLGLVHPESGEEMNWESSLPDDMQELLTALARDAQNEG
ncbi:MAG: 23S rRNA pseudouridine(1911/1915/1917) synthase RluD [Pseudohongiellaceae bacterium]